MQDLDMQQLVAELNQTADRLRDGSLEREEAAELVERCADLAGRIGGRLEREAREAASGGSSGQEQLL